MSRGGASSGTQGCHVCTAGKFVGIWRDRQGWWLRACGAPDCVYGYEFVMTREAWFAMRNDRHHERRVRV